MGLERRWLPARQLHPERLVDLVRPVGRCHLVGRLHPERLVRLVGQLVLVDQLVLVGRCHLARPVVRLHPERLERLVGQLVLVGRCHLVGQLRPVGQSVLGDQGQLNQRQ